MAGFVDACAYLALGGYFAAFMSGNSTRLGVAFQAGAWRPFGACLATIGAFVGGVIAATLIGRRAGIRRKAASLATGLLLLIASASLARQAPAVILLALLATAMGARNSVFQREGEVTIAVSYMTGTLVRCAQGIAAALAGGDRWGWLRYFLLWASFLVGVVAGAACQQVAGLRALWIAVAIDAAVLVLLYRQPAI